MGGGLYSVSSRADRAADMGYLNMSKEEIFTKSNTTVAMNPNGVKIRESRDSDEHPDSVPIILALDVTASMGDIPYHMVREGLPQVMGGIIQSGIPDPQLMIMGIGDHECDGSPLQIGQFESSDELIDKWLTDMFLEGGGGGNYGESYHLAWYFAAMHTVTDRYEKRGKKGFLFTIGDEPVLDWLPGNSLPGIMGHGQYGDYTANQLLSMASEKYDVYHIHVTETMAGRRRDTIDKWKQLMGDNLIILDDHRDISKKIAEVVVGGVKSEYDTGITPIQESPTTGPETDDIDEPGTGDML